MADTPKPPKAPRKPAPKAPAKTVTKPGERIAKMLSRAGVASRREAERMIERGEVAVNGAVIASAALDVLPTDRVTVNGQPVAAAEEPRLWLYYKPEGLVTTRSDEKGRKTVFDALPPDLPRVMTVGRLDLNSEGLLLLTNDGGLKRRLELPSTGWLRKYRVRIKGNPTDPDLEPLRAGITVEGERFQPMTVSLDRVQGANAWLTVGLREGRNREIRRALMQIGLTVNRLIRISYGPFRLNDMEPGAVEEIKPKVLREQLGLEGAEPAEDSSGTARRRTPAAPRRRTDAVPPVAGAVPAAQGTRRQAGKGPAKPAAKPARTAPGPAAAQPGAAKPARATADRARPDRPAADLPKADRPKSDRPHSDRPRSGSPAPRPKSPPRSPRGR